MWIGSFGRRLFDRKKNQERSAEKWTPARIDYCSNDDGVGRFLSLLSTTAVSSVRVPLRLLFFFLVLPPSLDPRSLDPSLLILRPWTPSAPMVRVAKSRRKRGQN